MNERRRGVPSPARFGLTDASSETELRAAGWWDDTGPVPSAHPVLTALARAADPNLALRTLDRLRTAAGQEWPKLAEWLTDSARFRGRLFGVLGASTALGDHLVANPEQCAWLRAADPADPDEVLANALRDTAGSAAIATLRTCYRGLLAGIAAEDLAGTVEPELRTPSLEETMAALTGLAEAVLRTALELARAEHTETEPCSLAVIAMGKCGGRELNYVSDVDVVFVGEGDLPSATKLASAMIRIASAAAFEVDAALRPEGKAGALVRSLEGHIAYYEKWARTWEFQALLKARPVAGDTELGRRYLDAVYPMVWQAADRENFVADVQSMRRRVEEHIRPDFREREIKLGRGGLRDVEFAVQLLELVHGRTDEHIRRQSTMDGLRALGAGGYVARTDAAELAESYAFLRLLEHRLQLEKMRRTHVFPAEDDLEGLRWLARSARITPVRGKDMPASLLAQFRTHAARIRRLHEKLFYRPLLDAVSRVPTEDLRLTTDQAVRRLAALGFAAPDGALQHINALTSGVSRRSAIQSTLLPALLGMFADTPDPDGGLLAYRKVSDALAETPWYLRFLRDEGTVAQRFVYLLGTAKLIPDLAVRAPETLRLLANDSALAARAPEEVTAAMRSAVARHGLLTNAVSAARSLRRHELLRIACADLLGMIETETVCAALSTVWTAVLQAVLYTVDRAESVAADGRKATIAVIGMGRIGGRELGYGSDADVLFVCRPLEGVEDRDAVKYASRVAETVRRLLGSPSQDPPLQVDADLRPEGKAGPLVRTLSGYRGYYEKWADTWEFQALLRARPIAGDEELGAEFLAIADRYRYPEDGIGTARATEIRRMKARVENERLPRGTDPSTNTKLGKGGLADVEWLVQLLQLEHAGQVPELRTPSTIEALRAAQGAGLIEEPDAEALLEAWLLATKARNATMLVRGKQSDQLPRAGRELTAVASVCGFENFDDPGEFLDHYKRTARHAREVFERLFYDA
ncbi:bifunctional [glutamine synthetase] adenylyltransferase/[glutamine synthetase]-adenylyl-L-tyrosine phosphorylase [Sciscionella sediminilitoris]|uniref:bifunctional [glutamine synthetase] adenylyltransferase/[glutamine synthetase]-adenylyl-L-tyrosine phosphorylase n=1 Tax=Sciscionella sediminilitoris TaxID=1445613 RepID=UPI0004DF88A3|nr:bifunctional [glutamine synthetase] adenylyltransferase/[glutamine synthetase]-adenylyl-L-tyrosine phosphorylase [Sciscionella sp. SE31]